MRKFWNSVLDSEGRPRSGAEVVIKHYPSGDVATIYSANDPIPGNEIAPLLTDSEGYFEFYAQNGRYTVEVYVDGLLEKTIADALVTDPQDASEVNIDGGAQNNVAIATGTIGTGVTINVSSSTGAQSLPSALNDRAVYADLFNDHVVSGLLPATDLGLTSDIAEGSAYVMGRRVTAPVTSHTYTASRDTYLDVNNGGSLIFTEVSNGGPEPSQPVNSIRLAKVVTDAGSIVSVEDRRPSLALKEVVGRDITLDEAIRLAAQGYNCIGQYAAGLDITTRQQVVRDTSGGFWRVTSSTPLPYTTTGAGLSEGGAFVGVGDDEALREELANDGSDLVTVETDTGIQSVAAAINDRVVREDQPLTVTVGAGGDFASITAALGYLSGRHPATFGSEDYSARVNILSGTVIGEQVIVRRGRLNWIEIVSEDAEVTVDRSALTQTVGDSTKLGFSARYPFIGVEAGGAGPRISCLFNMDNSGDSSNRAGFYVGDGSLLEVSPGAGIKNAANMGCLVVFSSSLVADGAIFDGAGDRGIYAIGSCQVSFKAGSAVGVGWTAFQMHSSVGDCTQADLRNAGHYGCRARNGASVEAREVDVSGAGDAGFNAIHGAHISAPSCTCEGILGAYGAIIQAGTVADFSSSSFINANDIAIRASSGAVVNCSGVDATGSGGTSFVCDFGAVMNGRLAIGTTNLRRNEVTENGIIFDQQAAHGFSAEGDWTPTLAGSSVAGSHNYTTRTGKYYRAGNMVLVTFSITLDTKDAAMDGNIHITGMPFGNIVLSTGGAISAISGTNNLPADFGGQFLINTPAGGILRLGYITDTGGTSSVDSSFVGSSNFRINGSITYISESLK